MICILALIVFAVMALFSAKYRPLAKEAYACVFLKLRMRPCESGLDRRLRVGAMMPFVKRTPRLAKAIYRFFPVISWTLVILTVVSFGYLVYGGYNYALYGNCNGPGSTGFCVFDPSGAGASAVDEKCRDVPSTPENLLVPTESDLVNGSFKTFHPDGKLTVVFFGCYSCEYTRKGSSALLDEIERRPDVRFIIIDFPLPKHANSTLAANAGNCVYDSNPATYPAYARLLYSANLSEGLPSAIGLGVDDAPVAACAMSEHARVTKGKALGSRVGIYGTPTYFINGKAYVGPLNRRALDKLIGK